MNESRKRRLWQFHLSTALVLMVVAAGLLWRHSDEIIAYNNQRKMNADVDEMMIRLKRGEFREVKDSDDIAYSSGWTMENLRKQTFLRSELQYQAEPLIAKGTSAVPQLMHWVDDDDITMRYIARYSLESITLIDCEYSYFEPLDKIKSQHLSAPAMVAWNEWYIRETASPNHIGGLPLDIAVLIASTLICEYLVRRREVRRQ